METMIKHERKKELETKINEIQDKLVSCKPSHRERLRSKLFDLREELSELNELREMYNSTEHL